MRQVLVFLLLLLLLFICEFSGNIYDPQDHLYEKPSFTIDTAHSDFEDGDTGTSETVRITLIGNDEKHHHNHFRWSLDT